MSKITTPPSPTRNHYVAQQLMHASASTPEGSACPICFEDWNDESILITTHCKHTFHRECFVAWLGKEDVDGANSCPSCRAVCFPKVEQRKETGLTFDMSFLYRTMRSEYVMKLPAQASAQHVVSDDAMVGLAFGEEEDDEE